MADIVARAVRFRAELAAREATAVRDMQRVYRRLLPAIDAELKKIRERIAAARRDGVDVARDMPAVLYQEGRIEALQRAIREQVAVFARAAHASTTAQIDAALAAATQNAVALIDAASPASITLDTIRVPTGAIETLTSATRQGAPVASLFNQLAPQATQAATDALLTGIVLGQNPNRIARGIRDTLNVPPRRAQTIARTEVMRAWREASRATYQANTDVVAGWIWVAGLDRRTCLSCVAQHGTKHPLNEAMATHPACRCVMVPDVRPWRELGSTGGEEPPPVETGEAWFRRQSDAVQRDMLGPGKHKAWRGNRITLPDLVARKSDPVWGPSTSEAPLKTATRNAAARRAA